MKKTTLKSIILSLIMATAITMIAQKSDGFFSYNEDIYQDRGASLTTGVGNQPFGTEPVPLGSGLLLLVAAGAGYAVARRKKARRNTTALLLASVMLLGMTQCKKKIDNTVVDDNNKVHITVNVGNGSRHEIIPNENGYVPVRYEVGDVIYVGDGSQYIGTLTCTAESDEHGNNATFSGDITEPNIDDVLHFYFVGGLTPQNFGSGNASLAAGETSFIVDITNQKDKLPVLSYTTVVYNGNNNLSCTLNNKCALVEFIYTPGTDKNVRVSNMLCEAKIDFANPGITPTGKLDAIGLYPQSSTKKWAILLPGPERYTIGMVDKGHVPYSGITWYQYDYYNEVTVDELDANDYLYGDNAININISGTPTMNNKIFVVSHNGNAVQFAHGNLQYQASTGEWRLAANQWDYVGSTVVNGGTAGGTVAGSSNNLISQTYDGWIDMFGWGTWGEGKNPWNSSTDANDYTWSSDFCHTLTNDTHTDWRTLTIEEWDVLNFYLNTSLKRAVGTIGGAVKGSIFIPTYVETSNFDNFKPVNGDAYYDRNTPTYQEWTEDWEPKGALFLPLGGMRSGTIIYNLQSNGGGYYWTSSPNTTFSGYAQCVTLPQNTAYNKNVTFNSFYGACVRLAR